MTDEISTRSLNCAALALSQGAHLLRSDAISETTVLWVFSRDVATQGIFSEFESNKGLAAVVLAFSAARRQLIGESKRALADSFGSDGVKR